MPMFLREIYREKMTKWARNLLSDFQLQTFTLRESYYTTELFKMEIITSLNAYVAKWVYSTLSKSEDKK